MQQRQPPPDLELGCATTRAGASGDSGRAASDATLAVSSTIPDDIKGLLGASDGGCGLAAVKLRGESESSSHSSIGGMVGEVLVWSETMEIGSESSESEASREGGRGSADSAPASIRWPHCSSRELVAVSIGERRGGCASGRLGDSGSRIPACRW